MKKLFKVFVVLAIAISMMPVSVSAEEQLNNFNEEKLNLNEYKKLLNYKTANKEDMPLPVRADFRNIWIESTTKLLESKNYNHKITNVIENNNSVTFIFEPIAIDELLELQKVKKSNQLSNFNGSDVEMLGYLQSVTYSTTASGSQTRIDNWFNALDVINIDSTGKGKISQISNGVLTILSFVPDIYISTTASVISVFLDCLEYCGETQSNTAEYKVISRTQPVYKTKQCFGYSGIAWVVGAQVQRQEDYCIQLVEEYNPSNHLLIDTYTKANYPNASLNNWNAYREKKYYDDETWLKERAIAVSKGQATVYADLYKIFAYGTPF